MIGWADDAEYRISSDPPSLLATIVPVTEEQAALTFLTAALPLALPLFDLEPIHGAAVSDGETTLLILGASGTGKSTTASWLVDAGWTFLADDAAAIGSSGVVWPGPPLIAMRNSVDKHKVVGTLDEKFVVSPVSHSSEPRSVTHVVILDTRGESHLQIEDYDQRGAVSPLLALRRSPFVLSERRRQLHLGVVAGLATKRVAVARYSPRNHSPSALAGAIAEWAKSDS